MIGTVSAAIMLIFTNGGHSNSVQPPSAIPFVTMADCKAARDKIESSDFGAMRGLVHIVCVESGASAGEARP